MATLIEPLRARDSSAAMSAVFVPSFARDSRAIGDRLAKMGVSVTVADVGEAMKLLAGGRFALCLVDLSDDRSAAPNIRALRAQHPEIPIAGLLDATKPFMAAEAIRSGAVELLGWPFDDRDVGTMIANLRERISVVDHDDDSVNTPGDAARIAEPLIAQSPAMRVVLDQIRTSAADHGGVLLSGEPSTGRQLIARAIHALGRPDSPFQAIDCATMSPEALEQSLFGIKDDGRQHGGSRGGAERIGKSGAIYVARGGTLFLGNVAEAPARVQAKLARLLRDREANMTERRSIVSLDVRAIASVDPGPEAAVSDGRLRRDLYERISTFRIEVPALRRRREDVPLLALHFLRSIGSDQGSQPKTLTRSALALLAVLPWPGNGRELRVLLELLVRSVDRPVIQLEDLLDHVRLDGLSTRIDVTGTLRDAKARFERDWISAMLMKHHGRVGEAAKALGIQRTNLYRKVRQLKVARTLLSNRRP